MSATLYIFLVLSLISFSCKEQEDDIKKFKVYTIGDSTMANKTADKFPETGWGQVLPGFFESSVTVDNRAKNGSSTKTFINEGRWQQVADSLSAGDYVFIQFGHNDEKNYDTIRYAAAYGLYKSNLEKFVKETQAKGAIPVLFTSIPRRVFKNGKLSETHGEYPEVVRLVSRELEVALVDLNQLATDYINSLGEEASKEIYLWAGSCNNYPDGIQDNTHLSEKGAHQIASLALADIKTKIPLLGRYIIMNVTGK
ncbi:MAG: rhamnogalacturonan acetylesterase [Bacteroidia bacterium]|nr:rhamnogalacturonan acetylesterase [Bacteroidia bacterium]